MNSDLLAKVALPIPLMSNCPTGENSASVETGETSDARARSTRGRPNWSLPRRTRAVGAGCANVPIVGTHLEPAQRCGRSCHRRAGRTGRIVARAGGRVPTAVSSPGYVEPAAAATQRCRSMTRRLEVDQVALEGADPAVEQTSGHGSLSRPWIKKENRSTRTSSSFRARYT
jgi:hypothetical protein